MITNIALRLIHVAVENVWVKETLVNLMRHVLKKRIAANQRVMTTMIPEMMMTTREMMIQIEIAAPSTKMKTKTIVDGLHVNNRVHA